MFNINCQIAPLLDAVHEGCYKDMHKYMKKREEFFNKEIANLKKKEQTLLKKLEKLDPPAKESAQPTPSKEESKKAGGAKKDANRGKSVEKKQGGKTRSEDKKDEGVVKEGQCRTDGPSSSR